MSSARCAIWLALLLAVASPATARCDDLHFVTIYGAQRPIVNLPRYTHTWATFVRLSGVDADMRNRRVESFTVSWLSEDLEVEPLQLRAVRGKNLTLSETLDWCNENRLSVSQFGPYRAKPELYKLMLQRWTRLERGEMLYRASDVLNGRGDEVCNCIYAVLDFDRRDRAIRPVTLGFGFKASAFVTRRLEPWLCDRDATYPWVSEMIGVKNYPCCRFGPVALLRD